ncbi:neuronal acetylcholine receptor subunit alpha-4-like [Uranotaenia lowii]|uniref:neuronal acetylcholine receptor subunit alpha-4-like n=1 Tax=Uranotaenia lowii TaxID=190385 RepID=UPI00247876A4|nr:neuronal acetylcholine receptor subunit alpha-4-like [Uranotaenia lowii]
MSLKHLLTGPLLLCVVIFFLVTIVGIADAIDCDKEPKHVERQLKKSLLCKGYDMKVRPVKDSKFAVNVSIVAVLNNFEFSDWKNTLDANMALVTSWKDEYLLWDPKDFENISSIILSTSEFWTPSIELFTSYAKPDAAGSCTSPSCEVKSDGSVVCVPLCDFTALCRSDYTRWPLDTQKCELYYGSWMESAAEIDYHSKASWIASVQTNRHIEWRVVSAKANKTSVAGVNETFPVLIFDYIIERHSGIQVSGLMVPILIIISFNLMLTWLNTESIERKIFLALSIFCHFRYLYMLIWIVPHNGSSIPGILLFYRNSMIITCTILIHTLIARYLKQMVFPPPGIVKILTGTVAQNKFGELVFSRGYLNVEYKQTKIEPENAEQQTEDRKIWISLSKIVDRVLFFVYLCIYSLGFLLYVPLTYKTIEKYELNVMG